MEAKHTEKDSVLSLLAHSSAETATNTHLSRERD